MRRHAVTARFIKLTAGALLSWLAAGVAVTEAIAQGSVFTDRTAFTSALQSSTTIDFAGLPDPPPGIGRSPITVSGVTFTNAESRLFTGSGYLWNFDSSYPVGVFLPGGINSFGADFSGGIIPQNNPFNATLTVNLVGGQTFTHNFTGQAGNWTFIGLVFEQNIQSLIYSDGGPFLPGAHEEMLDNVTFGVAVPEPSVAALGFAGRNGRRADSAERPLIGNKERRDHRSRCRRNRAFFAVVASG